MDLLLFLGVAALLVLSPGPDFLLVLRTAIASGRRAALISILGIFTGMLWWGLAAGLGLTALLAASETLYTVLRWAGAGYLTYLGIRLLVDTWRHGLSSDDVSGVTGEAKARAFFARGALTNVLNPKVGIFCLSLLPQFVPEGAPVFGYSLLLVGLLASVGMVWLTVVALVADRLGTWLRRPAVRRWFDRVAGAAFCGFAVRLALHTK